MDLFIRWFLLDERVFWGMEKAQAGISCLRR
jgi:hypothetical protein